MKFDKDWFDIISIFTREGTSDEYSVHAFKMPHSCIQFFITPAELESPTFWEDMRDKAQSIWEDKSVSASDNTPCPRCGTTRKNWLRWYEGRAFCGFCGLDIPDAVDNHKRVIRISKGNIG